MIVVAGQAEDCALHARTVSVGTPTSNHAPLHALRDGAYTDSLYSADEENLAKLRRSGLGVPEH